MMRVATEQQVKSAFRIAYNFMESHCEVLSSQDDYRKLASDMADAFASNHNDPLACRMISAVFDFICATSERNGGIGSDS